MANRPTQAKQKREIDKLKKDYCQLNIRVQTVEEEMKKVRRREIIRMLQEKTHHKSARYKHTYEEIAEEMDYSSTTVANIAKEEGLSRRISVVD
ncbi:hypothetical protein [Bacillus mycoides]|uniref:Uncharacterized protein n=1 Tax=Bacillus mycoides TaxID=1405 RepID=A0A4U3A2T0_BACMY|nr:hypothetical protein [Bacillus mycoides]TKI82226.1 hypothetical protein FC701_22195 [Bacillus mycoides]